jgi:hypothetical protein
VGTSACSTNDCRCASSRRLVDSSPTFRNHAARTATATGEPAVLENPGPPKPMADAGPGQEMLAEFNKLYETGEFQLGYCLADVKVNEQGTVDTVRIVRPQNVDKRVESAIVHSMKSRRYNPATACGRPVPFRMSVGVSHCPSRAERGGKPDG